jgi:hypothetical protein
MLPARSAYGLSERFGGRKRESRQSVFARLLVHPPEVGVSGTIIGCTLFTGRGRPI